MLATKGTIFKIIIAKHKTCVLIGKVVLDHRIKDEAYSEKRAQEAQMFEIVSFHS